MGPKRPCKFHPDTSADYIVGDDPVELCAHCAVAVLSMPHKTAVAVAAIAGRIPGTPTTLGRLP